jgi:hypothetical protein
MKSLIVLFALVTSCVPASAIVIGNDEAKSVRSLHVPRSNHVSLENSLLPQSNHKQKDNWGNAVEKDRKKFTIRASKNDLDDVSDDLLAAIKKANNGGLVNLKKNHKYVIGKKLDLTFLKDVYIKIDGELKVSSRVVYIVIRILTDCSSQTTLTIGKPTTSTMTSKRALRSPCGAASKLAIPKALLHIFTKSQRRQDLRLGCDEWKWTGMVGWLLGRGDPRSE